MSKRTQLLRNMKYKNKEGYSILLGKEECDICIEALEKQIAKKPKNINVLGEPFFEDEVIVKYGDCAICGFDVHSDICDYCPSCGTKIDWSDEDE